jgi:hypothetical protein
MLLARLLAYVTGTPNQELLLRNEYLAAENRIREVRSGVGCCFRKEKRRHWLRSHTGLSPRTFCIFSRELSFSPVRITAAAPPFAPCTVDRR